MASNPPGSASRRSRTSCHASAEAMLRSSHLGASAALAASERPRSNQRPATCSVRTAYSSKNINLLDNLGLANVNVNQVSSPLQHGKSEARLRHGGAAVLKAPVVDLQSIDGNVRYVVLPPRQTFYGISGAIQGDRFRLAQTWKQQMGLAPL
mmetsp:Transcript_745/g.1570  ORF Transcript_745/g.1570 Transcript_745/m.1570 type:complete len:152 (-) Transcript_745:192-647(-)